jgi:hypothetical protein
MAMVSSFCVIDQVCDFSLASAAWLRAESKIQVPLSSGRSAAAAAVKRVVDTIRYFHIVHSSIDHI